MNKEQLQKQYYFNIVKILFFKGADKVQKSIVHKLVLLFIFIIFFCIGFYQTAVSERIIKGFVAISWAVIGLIAGFVTILAYGYQRETIKVYKAFVEIGWVNYAGEAPVMIRKEQLGKDVYTRTFYRNAFPLSDWIEKKELLEIALGDNIREIILTCLAGVKVMPRHVTWKEEYLSSVDCELALGINQLGEPIYINIAKTPHVLIAGVTGSGKTILLQSIANQIKKKGLTFKIVDWKGSGDYSLYNMLEKIVVNDEIELTCLLDNTIVAMQERFALFRDMNISNIEQYNSQITTDSDYLKRIVIIIDELSMLLDDTGLDKEAKKKTQHTLHQLVSIARLGRAAGIHLVCATQRPDVNSVPGSLKAQLDIRICGRMPDFASSMVVLDDASAALLPSIPGRFLLRDGSGKDKIFQAFYYGV